MEIWKEIEGYEENYEVSNLGSVKSLGRFILKKGGCHSYAKSKILKPGIDGSGYYHVVLCVNGNMKTKKVHQLVAMAFLNHTPCGLELVINHKNFIRTDNRLDNLEIVTQRENANLKHIKTSSDYVGVTWNKRNKKWASQIYFNGKLKYLGLFDNELEASKAYQNELKKI